MLGKRNSKRGVVPDGTGAISICPNYGVQISGWKVFLMVFGVYALWVFWMQSKTNKSPDLLDSHQHLIPVWFQTLPE